MNHGAGVIDAATRWADAACVVQVGGSVHGSEKRAKEKAPWSVAMHERESALLLG